MNVAPSFQRLFRLPHAIYGICRHFRASAKAFQGRTNGPPELLPHDQRRRWQRNYEEEFRRDRQMVAKRIEVLAQPSFKLGPCFADWRIARIDWKIVFPTRDSDERCRNGFTSESEGTL